MYLELMYLTNKPKIAKIAELAGINRIWVDLEVIGKKERQGNIDSVKSNHTIDDISIVKSILHKSRLQVRVNPIHSNSEQEINLVINSGADIVMLPMFKKIQEVEEFIKIVNGKAICVLLLETKEAEEAIDEILELKGIDEIHIGLNDLHLAHKMVFMFELLANGTVERLCRKIEAKGIPYGFGGIGRIGEGILPAEYILSEHCRLGSTRAILSRSFYNTEKCENYDEISLVFDREIKKIRQFENWLSFQDQIYLKENYEKMLQYIKNQVNSLK